MKNTLQAIKTVVSRFSADQRGVVLYLVALLLIPLIILVAIAIDFSQFMVMKNQLAAAVDAAALDVGGNPNLTDADAQTKAQAYINANYSTTAVGQLTSVTVNRTTDTVDVIATASMTTTFLKVAGYNTLTVTVHSQATTKQNKLEVVLVLDNTGSMADVAGSSTKIEGLKTAATQLTEILFGNNDTSQYVKIGVVPFTAAVNVGTQYRTAPWMDTNGLGSLTRENIDVPTGQSLFSLFDEMQNAPWAGCVRQRTEPYDITEALPTQDIPDTLFTPYFAPDEPDTGGRFLNNYMLDGIKGSPQVRQRYVGKYNGASILSTGPNTYCPVKQLLRLTNAKQPILDEINGMTPYGNTVIPSGLMWGWHTLSPNAPFADGAPYSDPQTVKAIVLVTDGQDDISGGQNGFNQSVFNAYGYGAGPHLNLIPGTPELNLDQKLLALCNNIKAVSVGNSSSPKIRLYMIGLGNDVNSYSKSLLKQCASDDNSYFTTTTTDELITTFQKIAAGLNQLRLSK